MKITAALAWYDEKPETLRRMIHSLAGTCDTLVALDGAWQLFPDAAKQSAIAEGLAIIEATQAAGVELVIRTPEQLFDSQVAKRAELMRLANTTEPDWVLVIDADEHIEHTDPAALRAALAVTSSDVARVQIRNIGRDIRNTTPGPIRRLYRAATKPTVETAHNGYRTHDGRWLHGDPAFVQLEPAVDLSAHLQLVHDHDARDFPRHLRSRRYYMERRRVGAELWAGAR